MNTDTIDRSTYTNTVGEASDEEVVHTQPSQEEIAAQIPLSEAMLAVRKGQGYNAHIVDSGIAFRNRNATGDATYKWQRYADFERDHELYQFADEDLKANVKSMVDCVAVIARMQREITYLRNNLTAGYSQLGGKGREKFKKGIHAALGVVLDGMTS